MEDLHPHESVRAETCIDFLSAPEEALVEARRERPLVVLAEDDDDLRWSLQDLIVLRGVEVVALASGSALLQRLSGLLLDDRGESEPDLIVSDLRMPGFNGLSVLEGLRGAGWMTPFIVITAFADEATRARAARYGVTAFFEKPIELGEFERQLERAIGRSQSRPQRALPAILEDASLLDAAKRLHESNLNEMVVVREKDEGGYAGIGLITSNSLLYKVLSVPFERLQRLSVKNVALSWEQDSDPRGEIRRELTRLAEGRVGQLTVVVQNRDPGVGPRIGVLDQVDSLCRAEGAET